MGFSRSVNASIMRSINYSTILELIRRESPISRSKIAEQLDMSLPTVMRIVDELLAENLVIDTGDTEWSGGRRRNLLRFNSSGYVVIGIDLGGANMYGAVSDLGGRILCEHTIPHRGATDEESYDALVGLIEHLINTCECDEKTIRGIGVGAPGITHSADGIVVWAPSLNWRDFPLKERLNKRFGLPVNVDNDVNLATVGEFWFGAGEQVNNSMVFISIGTGIGAGIIIDGVVYRGSHEAAGEIGYLLPGLQYLGKTYEGFGAFESIASGTGIAERARNIILKQSPDSPVEHLTSEDVFAAYRQQQPWAVQVINETIDFLALGVSAVSVLFDPELIVIGGGIPGAAELLIPPILSRIAGSIPIQPRLTASMLGPRAAVMGTITSTLHSTTDYYVLRQPV